MSAADIPHERRDRRPLDDWQRIEAEQSERDAIRRKWDELHDPSDEFEAAVRPLGPDYGADRPRERTPEEMEAIRIEFGRDDQQIRDLRKQMFEEMEQRRNRWEASDAPDD